MVHDDNYKRPLEPECRIVQMCETGSVLAAKEQRNVIDFGATKRSSAAIVGSVFCDHNLGTMDFPIVLTLRSRCRTVSNI